MYQAPAPQEMLVWQLAEKFGWTLDYIEGLPLSRLHEWIQITDAQAKARHWIGTKDSQPLRGNLGGHE